MAYWPKNAPTKVTLKAFTLAFKSIGYSACPDGVHELGYEKIAIFALNGVPSHAARQLADGRWTHKMGQDIDLTASLKAVEGPSYGQVCRYYRKKIDK